jgi:hypothetical protein
MNPVHVHLVTFWDGRRRRVEFNSWAEAWTWIKPRLFVRYLAREIVT